MRPLGRSGPAAGCGGGVTRLLRSAGVLLAVIAAAGCDTPPPEFWTLSAEETLVIGADPVTPDTAFYRPTAVAVDDAGRLLVLDGGNDRIQVFDTDGSFLSTIGQSGAGPGDLTGPEALWIAPDGEIFVADTGNRRIARFASDGTPGPSFALEYVPVGLAGNQDRLFVLRLPTAAMLFGPETDPMVHVLDRSGSELGGALTPEEHATGIVYFLANTFRIAPDPEGGFALADVHVRGRVRRFGHDLDALDSFGVLYKADALAPLGWLPREADEASVQRIARPTLDLHWDQYQSLFWVLAGYVDRTADGAWVRGIEVHRYAADGDYRGSIVLPVPAIRIATGPDGALWSLDRDGVARRYRIHDPEGGPSWR